MAVGVRDYYEKLFGKGSVGYDEATKGVNVTHGGQTYNLGNAGLTLGDDNRYYADSEDYLAKLFADTAGWEQVRAPLQQSGQSVGWNDGKLITGGHSYNTNTGDFVNADGTLYTSKDNLERLKVPQYGSKYDDRFEEYLRKLSDSKFSYDPNRDRSLQQAQNQAMHMVAENMIARGGLDSSFTVGAQQRAAQELVPQYEQMAYGRYRDEKADLQNMINTLSSLDSNDLQRWQANQTNMYKQNMMTLKQEEIEIEKKRDEIQKAKDSLDLLGYANNETAAILNIDPNTPSKDARIRAEEMEDFYKQQDYKIKQEKEIMDYDHKLNEEAAIAAQGRQMNFQEWLQKLDQEGKLWELENLTPEEINAKYKAEAQARKDYPQLFINASAGSGRSGGSSGVRSSGGTSSGGGIDIDRLLKNEDDDNDDKKPEDSPPKKTETKTFKGMDYSLEDFGLSTIKTKKADPLIKNRNLQGDWVEVGGFGRLTLEELKNRLNSGQIGINYSSDGYVLFVKVG